MELSSIIHHTIDRSYEDLRQLQADCITALDVDRKRKIIDFCEIQRHRAVQLLALVKWSENEAEVVRAAVESIGDKAIERLGKYRATFWGLENSAKKFEVARAPKYDVTTAVDLLVNETFDGFPSMVDVVFRKKRQGENEDEQEEVMDERPDKRPRIMQNRIMSRLLSHEFDLKKSYLSHTGISEGGELVIDCEEKDGFCVKLALESPDIDDDENNNNKNIVWYPTWIRVTIKTDDRTKNNDFQFIPRKHIPLLADRLERYLAISTSTATVTESVIRFMRLFCATFVLQIFESQAKSMDMNLERIKNNDSESYQLALNIKDWFLLMKPEKDSSRITYQLLYKGKEIPFSSTLDGSNLNDLSLKRIIASAIREAAKHQLEQIREVVLQHATRHHPSRAQVRAVHTNSGITADLTQGESEFQLVFQLFHEASSLIVRVGENGSLNLSTTSKITRWGHQSTEAALLLIEDVLKKSPEVSWGTILADAWNRAEAWDCLASLDIPGLTNKPSALVPPDPEIARTRPPGPTAFWNLGNFEGFRYIIAVRYVPPASSFHSSFLPTKQRLNECTQCELISIEFASSRVSSSSSSNTSTRSASFPFIDISEGIDEVYERVRSMREMLAEEKLAQFKLERELNSYDWVGGDTEEVRSMMPYRIEFAEESDDVSISCQIIPSIGKIGQCGRNEGLEVAFAGLIRQERMFKRLQICNIPEVQVITDGFCEISFRLPDGSIDEEENILVGFKERKLSIVMNGGPHPLDELITAQWTLDDSLESLRLGLCLLRDSNILIRSAKKYARRTGREYRVCASSISNLHFFFDHPVFSKKTFDAKLDGMGKIIAWNRVGWDPKGKMMPTDPMIHVTQVAASLEAENDDR